MGPLASFPLKKGIFELEMFHILWKTKWTCQEINPTLKIFDPKIALLPMSFCWPKLEVPSFKCSSEYNRCGLTKVILYSHPKTNSSHMSGSFLSPKGNSFFPIQVCHPHVFSKTLFSCIRQLPKVALGWCLGKRWRSNHSQRRLSWRHFLLLNWRVKSEAILNVDRLCWAPHASGTLGVWSTTSISEAQPYVH